MSENSERSWQPNPLKPLTVIQIEDAIAQALLNLAGTELHVRLLGVDFGPDGRDSLHAATHMSLHIAQPSDSEWLDSAHKRQA